jgi:hypothetical protein
MFSRLRRAGTVARLVLMAPVALAAACSRGPATGTASSAPASAAPGIVGYQGELPPLPEVQFASARPAPITRAAYEFAARHPEVLRYMPCFCGCEKHGHGNNEDCFISRREADGRPAWNPHGIGCGICIDVAREAARLHKAGVSVEDVRAAIDRRYRTEYPTSTPTPKAPHGSPHD